MKEEIKPIHKFNGGRGATLCNTCHVIICTGLKQVLYCKEHTPKEVIQTKKITLKPLN